MPLSRRRTLSAHTSVSSSRVGVRFPLVGLGDDAGGAGGGDGGDEGDGVDGGDGARVGDWRAALGRGGMAPRDRGADAGAAEGGGAAGDAVAATAPRSTSGGID